MVKITLNGVEHEVEENIYLIKAASRVGVRIPHYCYHPALTVEGNCRMCAVEIEGLPKLQTACTTMVQDGMVVNTESEKVRKTRTDVMEFVLRNHPIDCPVCDQAGECGLQNYYMMHGLHDSRVTVPEKVTKKKRVDLGPNVVLDSERCILCARCVRFCQEVVGKEELVIANRGCHAEITTFPGRELTNDYSINTVDLCPVGALTSRAFRFKCRVWFMERSQSICPGCERGCNTILDQFQNEIQRVKPRVNHKVNGYWLCDEGRFAFDSVNQNRLLRAEGSGGKGITRSQVEEELAGAFANPADLLLVASPTMSNENLYALKKFHHDVIPQSTLTGGSLREKGEDDSFLRLPDKTPNSRGMKTIGIEDGLEVALGGGYKTVVVFENDFLGEKPGLADRLKGKKIIALMSNKCETEAAADLAVPVTTYAEMHGTFTNHAGLTQPFEAAIQPVGDSRPVYEILNAVAGRMGKNLACSSYVEVLAAMMSAVPSLGMNPDGMEK